MRKNDCRGSEENVQLSKDNVLSKSVEFDCSDEERTNVDQEEVDDKIVELIATIIVNHVLNNFYEKGDRISEI